MNPRRSALCIVATLLVASLAVATLVPQLPVTILGLGGQAPQQAAKATPTSTPLADPTGPSKDATAAGPGASAPTATPLPTITPQPTATSTPSPTPTPVPVLSRALFVDQDAQLVHVYENGVEIRTMPCSTGVASDAGGEVTPAWVGVVGAYVGTFYSFGTYQDEGWVLFKDFLIHGAPYTLKDGVKVYQDLDLLGVRPASHGCIRLSPEDALWLTAWKPQGVPMAISPLTREFAP